MVNWKMMGGNDVNDKHDEFEFTGLNIVRVRTILDGFSWIGIIRVGILWVVIIQGGNILVGNCPGGSYLG